MALRLREASLLNDINALKRRLIELETQVIRMQLFSEEAGLLRLPSMDTGSHLKRDSLGPLESTLHLDWFTRFSTSHGHVQQRDTETDRHTHRHRQRHIDRGT